LSVNVNRLSVFASCTQLSTSSSFSVMGTRRNRVRVGTRVVDVGQVDRDVRRRGVITTGSTQPASMRLKTARKRGYEAVHLEQP
jgi:hypothetical protein